VGLTLTTRQTDAYGLFICRVTLPDGRSFETGGLTAQIAEYRARVKAQENER